MKALITGGTGFVGRHLVGELVERGISCRLLVRPTSETNWLEDIDNIELWQGDITKPESLKGIAEDTNVIFHLAALLGSWAVTDEKIMMVNYEGTQNILSELNSDHVFVFCSTPGVQGFNHKRATEDLPYNPKGAYERSKAAAERIVIQVCTEKHINWVILRPDFVYGPADMRRVPLYKKIAQRKMPILGDGKSFLAPTYIEDVIQAFVKCLDNENAVNNIFNISGEPLTVEQYLTTIANTLNTSLPTMRIPLFICYFVAHMCELLCSRTLEKEPPITRSKVDFLTQDHGTDSQKARNLLGFKPAFSFKEGMRKTIEWCEREKLL